MNRLDRIRERVETARGVVKSADGERRALSHAVRTPKNFNQSRYILLRVETNGNVNIKQEDSNSYATPPAEVSLTIPEATELRDWLTRMLEEVEE